jgi:hypothetical protein
MYNDAVAVVLKIISKNSPGKSKGNHEKTQSGQPVTRQIHETEHL